MSIVRSRAVYLVVMVSAALAWGVLHVVPGMNTARASESAPLWDPPALTTPLTLNVPTSGGTFKLNAGQDYLVVMPTAPVTKALKLTGGRNVVLVGGEMNIGWQGDAAPASMRRALLLDGQTGTAHIEGLLLGGSDLSEGIQINAPQAVVQLVNVRVEGIRARDQVNFTDNHPDLVQAWGGVKELRVDGLTGRTDYQGIFLKPDYNGIGSVSLRRVNVRSDATARYLYWKDRNGFADFPVHVDDVWGEPASGRSFTKTLWPEGSDAWAAVKQGVPAAGDFVPAGMVGIGYTRSAPAPLPEPTETQTETTTAEPTEESTPVVTESPSPATLPPGQDDTKTSSRRFTRK